MIKTIQRVVQREALISQALQGRQAAQTGPALLMEAEQQMAQVQLTEVPAQLVQPEQQKAPAVADQAQQADQAQPAVLVQQADLGQQVDLAQQDLPARPCKL